MDTIFINFKCITPLLRKLYKFYNFNVLLCSDDIYKDNHLFYFTLTLSLYTLKIFF